MNREIKFRAWNGEYFHPLEDDGDYFFRDDGDGLRLHGKWGECKNTILLQFTGLKDKNGKEIYEGDILKFDDGRTAKIIWFETGWYIAGRAHSKIEKSYSKMNEPGEVSEWHQSASRYGNLRHGEIIGNIYETPEILQTS